MKKNTIRTILLVILAAAICIGATKSAAVFDLRTPEQIAKEQEGIFIDDEGNEIDLGNAEIVEDEETQGKEAAKTEAEKEASDEKKPEEKKTEEKKPEAPPCSHKFKTVTEKESTCEENGSKISTCEKCGLKVRSSIEKTGHDYKLILEEEQPIYSLDCSTGSPEFKVEYVCANDKSHTTCKAVAASCSVLKTPTTSEEGKLSYNASFEGYALETQLSVPKASYADWTWAFCRDWNRDGVPEMLPSSYFGYTTYTYRYKVNYTDLPGYPKVEDYDYSTDEEWDFAFAEDERLYAELVSAAIDSYGENSPEFWTALDEYSNRVNAIYDELYLKDEAAEELYQADAKEYQNTHDCSSVGCFSEEKSFTLTEGNNLCYWLHVPFDYDPAKSYPVVLFSPGEGGSLSDYLNADGSVKGSCVVPYGSDWCGSFFSNWYNQVKNPGEGRDKYDCFMIIIYPTNKFFRGEYLQGKGTAVGIVNMHSVSGIPDAHKYTPEEMGGNYKYSYYACYDASLLSPAKDAQLSLQLIDSLMNTYNIDPRRQYVLGASLGGIFTMDIISHYPDRFAAAVPVVSAAADISEDNCKNLLGVNVWAISGSGDSNCSKFHSKLFVDAINAARAKYAPSDAHTAQYSFFPGGHSCGYIGGTLRNADAGVSITYSTQVLDFMFNSVR